MNNVEKKVFETSKTTQNGKYKCSYFTKCGLAGTVPYQNLGSDYFTNKETIV
jgi:hypothetical protein